MNADEIFLLSLQEKPPPCIHVDGYARQLALDYKRQKKKLVKRLFIIFNRNIFQHKLKKESITVKWSKRMYRKLGTTSNRKSGVLIKLSIKSLNTAERLSHTYLHELCHAANISIDKLPKAGHSAAWQYWTNRSSSVFPNLPKITRLNKKLRVDYRFIYKCGRCDKLICRRQLKPSRQFRVKMHNNITKCCGANIKLHQK